MLGLAVMAALAAVAAPPPQELTLPMDDGVQIECGYTPPTIRPLPAPGVMLFHGLGGSHGDLTRIANAFAADGYATLACDARGHGASGGLADIDGPRTIADIREEFEWFARHEADAQRIGAWGISLGGGAVWRSLLQEIPFAAVETAETWTDLFQALAPQSLPKSGALAQFLGLPTVRFAPSILALKRDALAGTNLRRIKLEFADARSSRSALGRIHTPALIFQGRRDFAFSLEQGIELYRGLAGPKRLYIGDFGHAPSRFPGPDINVVVNESVDWFDLYLRRAPRPKAFRRPVELAPDPFHGTHAYAGLPPTHTVSFHTHEGSRTIGGADRVVRALGTTQRPLETFGSGTVRVAVTAGRGWMHLVAVLSARRPDGTTVVVADGGVPTTPGRRTLSIRLLSDVTLVPRASKLMLTLAGTSLAQSPSNALYLAGVPSTAQITIGRATVALPVLRKTISR